MSWVLPRLFARDFQEDGSRTIFKVICSMNQYVHEFLQPLLFPMISISGFLTMQSLRPSLFLTNRLLFTGMTICPCSTSPSLYLKSSWQMEIFLKKKKAPTLVCLPVLVVQYKSFLALGHFLWRAIVLSQCIKSASLGIHYHIPVWLSLYWAVVQAYRLFLSVFICLFCLFFILFIVLSWMNFWKKKKNHCFYSNTWKPTLKLFLTIYPVLLCM